MFGLTSGWSDYLIIRLIIRMPEIRIDSSSSPNRILVVLSICRAAIEEETASVLVETKDISRATTNNEKLEA